LFAAVEQVARARGDLDEVAEARLRAVGEIFAAAGDTGDEKKGQRRLSVAVATGTAGG
jgi:hypothetical protein